jgi:hypothetical protein
LTGTFAAARIPEPLALSDGQFSENKIAWAVGVPSNEGTATAYFGTVDDDGSSINGTMTATDDAGTQRTTFVARKQ